MSEGLFGMVILFIFEILPLLEKNDNYTTECNTILDKIQKNDWSIDNYEKFNNFYYKFR